MFGRVLLAALVGGALVFACDLVSLHALPYHAAAVTDLGGEAPAALPPALAALLPDSGVYRYLPADGRSAAVPLLVFRGGGAEPHGAMEQVLALAVQVGAALAAALLVALTRTAQRHFVVRWLAVLLLGCFAALTGPAADAVRYQYPWAFAWPRLADIAGAWAVAGLAMAALLGGPRGKRARP